MPAKACDLQHDLKLAWGLGSRVGIEADLVQKAGEVFPTPRFVKREVYVVQRRRFLFVCQSPLLLLVDEGVV